MPRKKKDDETRERRLDFMTDEEIRMVDDYLVKIEQNRGEMGDYYTRWEVEQEAYSGDQPLKDNRPNSRVNIIVANIDGQVNAMTEQNIAVRCRGEGPSDQSFARWGEVGLDWTLRKNHIKRLIERHERRRELFGPAWFKIHWDEDAVKGFGLARFTCPPLNAVFVDTKINDPLLIQDAEYIAEVMPRSRQWAKEKFGEEIAANILYGYADRSPVFAKERTTDDEDAFWYIQLWTKTDGKLRLIEFSDDGVLLSDSFKEWNGKRFVDIKEPEPFYRYNKYPYFLTTLYYEEGKLYGFGDGKLLRPLQDMINDLYDQIRRAARPNRIFFDPESNVELADIDEDDGPVPCEHPGQNIEVVEVGQVNPALWQLLANIHMEVQRVIRFSELMLGQKATSDTATEATIQQQQGAVGIDHKKMMLQETLTDMCEYALDLMMEKYTEGRAFRLDEDKNDYEWIDFRQLNEVPVMTPANSGFTENFQRNNPDMEAPKFMQLMDEDGTPMTKNVDLDIDISIGAGLPKNKAFLYQMAEKLSQVVIEGRNAISWTEFRQFVKDFLGFPLEDDEVVQQQMLQQQQLQQQQQQELEKAAAEAALTQPPMQNANTEGLSPSGATMMSVLPGGAMGG